MAVKLGSLIFSFFILALGSRLVTDAFEKLVKNLSGRAQLAVAAVLVALSTSLPELSVAIASAVEGRPNVSLSNLLGANVANLSLVVGGTALISGALSIVGNYWRHELAAAFLAGVAPIVLMMDGSLSRLDGAILLLIYLVYLEEIVVDGGRRNLAKESVRMPFLVRLNQWRKNGDDRAVLKLIVGLTVIMAAADLAVRQAVELATALGVPIAVIGFLVIAVGTTVPELALSLQAAVKKNVALILGNLLGSVVTNSTLIVGILAVLRPFQVTGIQNYGLNNVSFVIIFGLFWLFTSTRKTLSRFEGLILTGVFLCFAGLQLFLSVP